MSGDAIFGLIQLGLTVGGPAVLVVVGLTFGRAVEKRHLARLEQRRRDLAGVLMTNDRRFALPEAQPSAGARLVFGEAVVSAGYLKGLLAAIKKIFGGELRGYRTLMFRAREEAQLRMLESARAAGFDTVCNVRLEAVNLTMGGRGNNPAAYATILASGTAYRRAP